MRRFYTSDLHLGHTNIITYCDRPFDDPDHMNHELIQNWNSVVTDDDTVVVLGDFAMGKIAETLPLVAQLAGEKILLPGNHDRCWMGHPERKRKNWMGKYLDAGFDEVIMDLWYEENGVRYCHFPYTGDSHDADRYTEFRPPNDGMPLVHGHTHDHRAVSPDGKMVNIGVDAWDYAPILEEVVLACFTSS